MSATPVYSVHRGDVERDRATVLALWQGNLGQDARMAAKYDWFYRHCPYGEPLLLLLRHEASGAWVGIASAGPRRMQRRGQPLRGGVLVDLAVLPAHRSLGPALMLQQAMIAASRQRFDLLYGFPNPKASAVFKRCGYRPLGEMTRYARVLRHSRYLARSLPATLARPAGAVLDVAGRARQTLRAQGLSARWSSRVVPDMDALWADSPHGDGTMTVRDSTFLAWRFDRSPLVETRYLLVADRQGRLQAWFACEARDSLLHVRDAWSRAGIDGPDAATLAVLANAARAQGHDAVSVEFLAQASHVGRWCTAGYLERGQRPVFGSADIGDDSVGSLYLMSADEDE